MCWEVRIWDQGCGYRRHGDEEVWSKVCAETGYQACGCLEGNFFFDIEIQAVEVIVLYEGL